MSVKGFPCAPTNPGCEKEGLVCCKYDLHNTTSGTVAGTIGYCATPTQCDAQAAVGFYYDKGASGQVVDALKSVPWYGWLAFGALAGGLYLAVRK